MSEWWVDRARRTRLRRQELEIAQNRICAICGDRLLDQIDDPNTIDHVLPKCRGGRDELGNIVVTHWSCNSDKGDNLPTGCELVFLLAVNCRLGARPDRW